MKRLIAIILLFVSVVGTATAEYEEYYIRFGNVIDIEYDTDCVSVDDGMGLIWELYGLCDDFFYDDLVMMFIYDNGTAEWLDDAPKTMIHVTYDEGMEYATAYRDNPEKFFSEMYKKGIDFIQGL